MEISNEAANAGSVKKIYVAPELVEYGSVQKLTQSGATVSANDGATHRARRP
ncbi:MAG: lasso RiPP family leader peptide-containing protein [Acidobacteriota bacterium]|nr:lasso RiPP family leader peptide-containing protein [Acidobacteriota bacterium]